jgi:hypothetical protein
MCYAKAICNFCVQLAKIYNKQKRFLQAVIREISDKKISLTWPNAGQTAPGKCVRETVT